MHPQAQLDRQGETRENVVFLPLLKGSTSLTSPRSDEQSAGYCSLRSHLRWAGPKTCCGQPQPQTRAAIRPGFLTRSHRSVMHRSCIKHTESRAEEHMFVNCLQPCEPFGTFCLGVGRSIPIYFPFIGKRAIIRPFPDSFVYIFCSTIVCSSGRTLLEVCGAFSMRASIQPVMRPALHNSGCVGSV